VAHRERCYRARSAIRNTVAFGGGALGPRLVPRGANLPFVEISQPPPTDT
jgi:hypothetical protein